MEKLSVRIETSKASKGQAGHDFDRRPAYADENRRHLNKTLVGGDEEAVKRLIVEQSKSIITRFNENAFKLRKECKTPQERRKIGSWRKTTATHKKAILTFNSEFRANDLKNKKNRDELDQCAMNFFDGFCDEHGCTLTYIVRHDDEATPHYHAMFTNVNEKTLKPLRLEMRHLSTLQDRAGEAFSSMGIERGTMRNVRIAKARAENPQLENESTADYRKRTYKLAGVLHKSVSQLHESLPAELAEKEAEVDTLIAKLTKVEKNLAGAENKLKNTTDEDLEVTNKIEKNIRIYQRRKSNIKAELGQLQSELNLLKKADFNKDLSKKFKVVTGKKGILNTPVIEERELISPKNYNKAVKILKAKQTVNDERVIAIKRKEQQLRDLEQGLNNDRASMDLFKDVVEKINIQSEKVNGRLKSTITTIAARIEADHNTSGAASRISGAIDRAKRNIEKQQYDQFYNDDCQQVKKPDHRNEQSVNYGM